jgi:glucokinase
MEGEALMAVPGLIADIGGTNVRFALVDPGSTEAVQPMALRCADYAGPAEAAEAYLRHVAPAVAPNRAAFDVASPVLGDSITLTNHAWRFSVTEVRDRLGLARLDVVNDFTAVALAVPWLADADKVAVSSGVAAPGGAIAVLGPGTGLGVSSLIPVGTGWQAVSGEGGHVTMPATNEQEAAVLAWLRARHGHVSAERVLSGPGLVNIYLALASLGGTPAEAPPPDEVTRRAADGDPLASTALAMFFSMLGTVAGDIALTVGARGGVIIAGGIIPKLLPSFLASDFHRRFADKGRFASYLSAIPIHVVTHPYPAFVGLAGLVTPEALSTRQK